MMIRFVRLEDDVCERVNGMAIEQRQTVSELVNEILREYMTRKTETASK
jgi:predicted transcriptional regulator